MAVTYAFSSFNIHSSLGNSFGLPAIPFRSDTTLSTHFAPNDWMACDSLIEWYSDNTNAGEKACWNASSDQITLELSEDNVEGAHSVRIQYGSAEESELLAGIRPTIDTTSRPINLKKYKTILVLVKNPDDRAKALSLLVTDQKGTVYQASALNEETSYTVEASSGFTRYTFSLDSLVDRSTGELIGTPRLSLVQLQFTIQDSETGSVLFDNIELGLKIPEALSYSFDYAYSYGDIDQNGSVNASDALLVLQSSVKLKNLNAMESALADVDVNTTVDASDALHILQHSVNLIERFSAEQ